MTKVLQTEKNPEYDLRKLNIQRGPLWIQLTEDVYGSHDAHNLKAGNVYKVEQIGQDYMGYGIFYFRADKTQQLCNVRPGGCRWTFDKRTAQLWRQVNNPRRKLDLE